VGWIQSPHLNQHPSNAYPLRSFFYEYRFTGLWFVICDSWKSFHGHCQDWHITNIIW
jgi:hypothetical protein